ncbi:hypothetical protein Droror1_Dr00011091 [Drosera rotundifolia]
MADKLALASKPVWMKTAEEAKLKNQADKEAAFEATFKALESSTSSKDPNCGGGGGSYLDSDDDEGEEERLANKPILGSANGGAAAPPIQRVHPPLLRSLMNWFQRKLFLYNVTFGLYMLDWWESCLFNTLMIMLMTNICYNGVRYIAGVRPMYTFTWMIVIVMTYRFRTKASRTLLQAVLIMARRRSND